MALSSQNYFDYISVSVKSTADEIHCIKYKANLLNCVITMLYYRSKLPVAKIPRFFQRHLRLAMASGVVSFRTVDWCCSAAAADMKPNMTVWRAVMTHIHTPVPCRWIFGVTASVNRSFSTKSIKISKRQDAHRAVLYGVKVRVTPPVCHIALSRPTTSDVHLFHLRSDVTLHYTGVLLRVAWCTALLNHYIYGVQNCWNKKREENKQNMVSF